MKIAARWGFFVFTLVIGMGFLLPAAAQTYLSDDFDSYANQAAFEAVWTDSTGTGLALNTTTYDSSPNAVWNPSYATAGAASRQYVDPVSATDFSFTFDFFDDTVADGRDYCMLYSRAGDTWAGALQNILAIGQYNNLTTPSYYGRIYLTSGVVFGDGVTANNSGWFDLGGAGARSVGWHTAEITGQEDPANPGKARYEFYIDGELGGSVANAAVWDFNWVVLGSGLSTANGPLVFDNVQLGARSTAIPEPSTAALGLLGLVALAYRLRHRR